MSKQVELLNNYIEKIDSLVEVDYGDFKRKLGQYIITIEEALYAQKNPEINKTIANLRRKTLFQTDADVEACRDLALEKLNHLIKVIQ